MSIYVKTQQGYSYVTNKLEISNITNNVTLWTYDILKGFKISQSTSTQVTTIRDIFKLSIDSKYYPLNGPILNPCTMFNKGDNHHYNGFFRMSETCSFTVCAITTAGGLIDIADGSSWYIWSLNMIYI